MNYSLTLTRMMKDYHFCSQKAQVTAIRNHIRLLSVKSLEMYRTSHLSENLDGLPDNQLHLVLVRGGVGKSHLTFPRLYLWFLRWSGEVSGKHMQHVSTLVCEDKPN